MTIEGYFTPYRKMLGDCWDLDLGSAGPLLIPRTPFLVSGGKEGILYVLDRSHMGGYDDAGAAWSFNVVKDMFRSGFMHSQIPADDPSFDRVQQKFQVGENRYEADYAACVLMKWPHIHGTPAFARFDAQHAYMFVWPEKDSLKRYEWKGERFDRPPERGSALAPPNKEDPLKCFDSDHPERARLNGMPGGMLSVNIDPTEPSLGVVLASVKICDAAGYPKCDDSQHFGVLRAYDPFTMQEVWSNQCTPQEVSSNQCEDKKYWFAKFVPPTVAAERIFLPTASGKVLIYGP